MPLEPGSHAGPYEILSLVGTGGMGEVYRARDKRLNRTVAIKVLTRHISDRAELRARFEREAQTLASLSHPHICPVFDVGHDDGIDYLVMEYLEGPTLADRLERGALPLDEALRIAIEIADALDKAHRQGIVHRDLKPGNIMLTKSGAKLLDFGLAKLTEGNRGVNGLSALPTNVPMTAEGTILGTLQYMAPEQLEAKDADARTDIFAFGAIVYEMVTGKKTFEGKSQASLIAAILDREPPAMSTLRPLTPRSLERVVRKCLAKDPDGRWQSAADLLDELKWVAEGAAAGETLAEARKPKGNRLVLMWATIATVLLAAAMLGLGFLYVRPAPEAGEIRFEIPAGNIANPRHVTISPDGRWIAYTATSGSSSTALFVRRIESVKPEQLPGTDGATSPFWSPDSRHLGFFAAGRLKRIDVTGGPPQNICVASNLGGGTWNAEGVIVFSAGGVLNRVSAAGGEPVALSVRDESIQETSHQHPHFLPDGRRYLYLAWSNQQSNRAVYVGALDSKDRTKLFDSQSKVVYANSGDLLFHREGTLFAQKFDADKAQILGDPVPVAEEISYEVLGGEAAFSLSQNGRLVYYAGGGPAVKRQFVWLDRTGTQAATAGSPDLYTTNFDLSPNGALIAVARRAVENSRFDVWFVDWARGVPTRFTFDPALSPNGNVAWSPDGLRVAFASERNGNRDIYEKNASGVGGETPLLATPRDEWPEDWSKDGRYLAFGVNTTQGSTGSGNLYILPLFGARTPIPLAQSPFTEDEPRFSFDGKWIAYNSNESGTHQVYLVSFPALDQKRQISTDGGVQPRWRRDGKELYYLALDGRLMAVDLLAEPKIESGVPRQLFNTRLAVDPIRDQYAVSADGQRFLVQRTVVEGDAVPLTVRVDWAASLRK